MQVMELKLLFTSTLLFVVLLSKGIDSIDAFCLPCQAAFSNIWHPGLPRRTVYNPKITHPTAATTWKSGSLVTVTWDRQGIPPHTHCSIALGYLTRGRENEHLSYDHPLADCEIGLGKVTFKLPRVRPRDNYIIVLFGDSGNRSPMFRIIQ